MSLNLHHTPGPLRIAGRETRGLPHTLVAARTLLFRVYSEAYGDFDQETENARRLVACWNACEGISTESLERSDVLSGMNQLLRRLETQRDELLSALRHIEGVAMADEPRDLPGIAQTARTAIYIATGGAA